MTGFEICFQNGSSILLGAKGNVSYFADLTRKVKSIHLNKTFTGLNGTFRKVRFCDDKDSQIGFISLDNPLFSESVA